MRAEDIGAAYLPQTVVTKTEYDSYVSGLKSVDLKASEEMDNTDLDTGEECSTGACPIK